MRVETKQNTGDPPHLLLRGNWKLCDFAWYAIDCLFVGFFFAAAATAAAAVIVVIVILSMCWGFLASHLTDLFSDNVKLRERETENAARESIGAINKKETLGIIGRLQRFSQSPAVAFLSDQNSNWASTSINVSAQKKKSFWELNIYV